MGNEESVNKQPGHRLMESYSYAPVAIDHRQAPKHTPASLFQESQGPLLRTAYHGEWSMDYPDGVGPCTRIGQCSVYDSTNDRIIIAYGCDSSGNCLNDAWALDLRNNRWEILNRELSTPRQYVSATLIGRQMILFGGVNGHEFYSDLHSLDIDTGAVNHINADNTPSPRSTPVLFSTPEGNLYVWSGFDGAAKGGVHMLQPGTSSWVRLERAHTGRPAAAFCEHKGRYFVFGSTKGHALLEFHPSTGEFEPLDCKGTVPSAELTRASLVSADEYLFLIGGEAESQFMHIYALEVKRMWWFAFHVRPDLKSISLADGNVNKNGLFMLPREHSASVWYSPGRKELVSLLGSRLMNPAPAFRLSIGDALASLHMRSDMFEVFQQAVEHA